MTRSNYRIRKIYKTHELTRPTLPDGSTNTQSQQRSLEEKKKSKRLSTIVRKRQRSKKAGIVAVAV